MIEGVSHASIVSASPLGRGRADGYVQHPANAGKPLRARSVQEQTAGRQEAHVPVRPIQRISRLRSRAARAIECPFCSGSARCIDDWVKPDQLKDIERAALPESFDWL